MQRLFPLSAEERDHLRHMFRIRLRVFAGGYAFFFLFLGRLLVPYAQMDASLLNTKAGKSYNFEMFGHVFTHRDMFYTLLCFFLLIILGTAIPLFYFRLFLLLKDLRSNQKEGVAMVVRNKWQMDHTKNYFLCFDDPRLMHYEVAPETYYSTKIGSEFLIFRGRYSRYVFQKDFRFTAL